MSTIKTDISDSIQSFITRADNEVPLIQEGRKAELKELSNLVSESIKTFGYAKLIFVCTHNSRRSQLGQVCLRAAAESLNLNSIQTYSGGTEATAFNYRMVAAVKKAGFEFEVLKEGENPEYQIHFSKTNRSNELYFSKKYDHSFNPQEQFIAVMVCDQADAECPFIPGAFKRFSLPYLDPKAFDDTENEAKAYDEKVLEIGREMMYLAMLLVSNK